MRCCFCGHEDSRVTDSRYLEEQNAIRRRRECLQCGKRFNTFEVVESTPILVIKKNGEREPFRLDKVKAGMIKSCEKRPVSLVDIEKAAQEIENKIVSSGEREIKSLKIGEYVMDALKELDQVAYVRFASVYKQFEDFSTFQEFVQKLSR